MLREIIIELKKEVLQKSIQTYCYYYIRHIPFDKIDFKLEGDEDLLAIKGYMGIKPTSSELNKIVNSKQPIKKGFHFSDNIFRLLGIFLASNDLVKDIVNEKFGSYNIKQKFLVFKIIPDFKNKLASVLAKENSSVNPLIPLLEYIVNNYYSDDFNNKISSYVRGDDLDIIDLIILEDLLAKSISLKYKNLSSSELVKKIIQNFGNSIKKITSNRRKNRKVFQINDEYDVQDLIYTILKSVFNDLTYEESNPKVGGKSTKSDLCIPSEGLKIEVKMIKNHENETKYIREIKEDIESYYKYPDLKELIFFIYDPYNNTRDDNSFYDLKGPMKKKQHKFNVDLIVSR